MLSPADQAPGTAKLVDSAALAADLEQLAEAHAGRDRELRTAIAQRLKRALADGRAQAEQLLLQDRRGRLCAERLCVMQDEVIRVLYEFICRHLYRSDNPSEAERMTVVATGGYGRGLMAP